MKASIDLQDMVLDLDSLTEVEDDSLFSLHRFPSRSYEKDYFAQFDLSVEMQMDTIEYKRMGYHLLDFISDIGGVQSLMFSMFAFMISVWNYNMIDNYMVSRLYKLESTDKNSRRLKDAFRESEFMEPRRFFNPKEYFRNLLPDWACFCTGCKADRKERGF